jgi:hypothetical protein
MRDVGGIREAGGTATRDPAKFVSNLWGDIFFARDLPRPGSRNERVLPVYLIAKGCFAANSQIYFQHYMGSDIDSL